MNKTSKPKNKIRFNSLFIFITFLILIFLPFFVYKIPTKTKINKTSKQINIKTSTKSLSALKADLDGNGSIEEIKLNLVEEVNNSNSRGELNIFSDKKLVDKKNINLEWKQGELEVFDLFNNKTKQIFVSSIVGAHSTLAHLFKFESGKLVPICTEQIDSKNEHVCEFFIDSNLYMPFSSRDLDGNGIKELFGQKLKEGKLEYTFYKWTGNVYKRLNEEENALFTNAMKLEDSIPITPTPMIVKEIIERQCEIIPTLVSQENKNTDEIARLKNEIQLKNVEIEQLKNSVSYWRNKANTPHYCPPGVPFSPF